MGSPEPKKAEVVRNHPRMISMLARRFIFIMRKEGREKAVNWGMNFFPKDTAIQVAQKVEQLLKGGY